MNDNFYQNQREIDLGERDRLEPPKKSENTCATLGCNREPLEDEEYCAECTQCQAEYEADTMEDR